MHAPAVDPKPQRGGRYVRIAMQAIRRSRLRRLALIAALACGCNLDNKGDPPPEDQLYFTNALVLSVPPAEGEAPRYLFAANSNYDLRYNAGSVLAIDLDLVSRRIASHPNQPGYIIEPQEVIVDEAFIGSYSTSLGMAPDGETLFVATRTDDSLAFIRVNPEAEGSAVLRCEDEDGEGRECGLRATPIIDPTSNTEVVWPPDPTSVLAQPLVDFLPPPADPENAPPADPRLAVLVSHRDGLVSLFTSTDDGFEFVDVIGGFGSGLTGLDFEPTSRLAYGSSTGAAFARVGVAVADEQNDDPECLGDTPPPRCFGTPALYGADAVPLAASAPILAGRDLEFLPKSGAGLASTQNNMLVVGQNPNALLLVALTDQPRNGTPPQSLQVLRTTVVGFGAYRVATGMLGDRPIALVSCLDSRSIHVIDLNTMLTLSVVPQLSGPFDIQYDEVRQRLYVADYLSSVIRVLDLTPVAESNGRVPALLVASIGEPRVIQELR